MNLKYFSIFLLSAQCFLACETKETTDLEFLNKIKKYQQLPAVDSFCSFFIETNLINKDFDSLILNKSSRINEFCDTSIGMVRFSNPGAMCYAFIKHPYNINFISNKHIPSKWYDNHKKMISGKLPNGGFCSPSSDIDGIYLKPVEHFPPAMSVNDHSDVGMHKHKESINKSQKFRLVVLIDGFIFYDLYFVTVSGKWNFYAVNCCDCST